MKLKKIIKSAAGGLCGTVLTVSVFAAELPVDLELALGVDVSGSIDEEEARLQELERLAREQSSREAQTNQLAGEQLIVSEYVTIIRRVISQNWQIPPSARNGMTAAVQIRVVPTGEVVNVFILESSGNPTFDRSVLQAVERVERFPELQDLETGVFERNFRTFSLLFRPEDLLR